MNKAVLHKCVLAALVACIAAQSILIARPTNVSEQKSNSYLLLSTFSETTTLFLSPQNRPKTGSVFSAMDGYSPVGLGGQGLWNIFHRNTLKSNGRFHSLCQAAAPVSLYALSCQFTL